MTTESVVRIDDNFRGRGDDFYESLCAPTRASARQKATL